MRYQGFFSVDAHTGFSFTVGSRVGVVCGAGLLKRNIGIVSRGASYYESGTATYPVAVRYDGFFSVAVRGGYSASNLSSRVSVVCGAGLLKS